MDPTNRGAGASVGDIGNALFCALLILVVGAFLWGLFLIFFIFIYFITNGLLVLGIIGLICYLVVVPQLANRWHNARIAKKAQANQPRPSL